MEGVGFPVGRLVRHRVDACSDLVGTQPGEMAGGPWSLHREKFSRANHHRSFHLERVNRLICSPRRSCYIGSETRVFSVAPHKRPVSGRGNKRIQRCPVGQPILSLNSSDRGGNTSTDIAHVYIQMNTIHQLADVRFSFVGDH